MKRRSFFKTAATILGAAVVVPEVIRGNIAEKSEKIVVSGTTIYDNTYIKESGQNGYYYKENLWSGPQPFTVNRVEECAPGFPFSVCIKPDEGNIKFFENYFRMNDSVLAYSMNLDKTSLFIIQHPASLLISPIFNAELRLNLISVDPDPYPIQPGDKIVRYRSLCPADDKSSLIPRR